MQARIRLFTSSTCKITAWLCPRALGRRHMRPAIRALRDFAPFFNNLGEIRASDRTSCISKTVLTALKCVFENTKYAFDLVNGPKVAVFYPLSTLFVPSSSPLPAHLNPLICPCLMCNFHTFGGSRLIRSRPRAARIHEGNFDRSTCAFLLASGATESAA